jgi:hypothetical protein
MRGIPGAHVSVWVLATKSPTARKREMWGIHRINPFEQ